MTRLDFIINKYKVQGLDYNHDKNFVKLHVIKTDDPIEDIIRCIADRIDPTTRKIYTQWLVDKYDLHQFSLSDIYHWNRAMADYHAQKRRLKNPEHRDINRIESILELYNIVQGYDNYSPEVIKASKIKSDKNTATLLYEDKNIRVLRLNEYSDNKFYSAGTTWCTKCYERFLSYTSHSPLYIIQSISSPDDKSQLHFPTNQLADRDNTMYSPFKLVEWYPQLRQIEEFRYDPKNAYCVPFFEVDQQPELIKAILKDSSIHGHTALMQSPAMNDDLIRYIIVDMSNLACINELLNAKKLNEEHLRLAWHTSFVKSTLYPNLLRSPNFPLDLLHEAAKMYHSDISYHAQSALNMRFENT